MVERSSEPGTLVTFERRVLKKDEVPKWKTSTTLLTKVHVEAEGLIEEEKGKGHMHVDFANKYLGN